MIVNLTQNFGLPASQQEAWKLLRETERFALLIPGVKTITQIHSDVSRTTAVDGSAGASARDKHGDEKYKVRIEQSVGPFRFGMDLHINVVEAVEPSLLRAQISGADAKNRVKGTLTGRLASAEPSGSNLEFACSVEVLGALAALGAPAIRRKSADIFVEFTENVKNHLGSRRAAPLSRRRVGRIVHLVMEWLSRVWRSVFKP